MTFAPVGIRCPEHASVGAPKRSPQRTVQQARARTGALAAPAVVALVAANVIVYLITASQGGGPNQPGGSLFFDWALAGVAVANGDWYRLVTAMFLHGGLLHLAFNMLALWWLGSIVEQAIGTVRFLLVYFVSGLAGSAGALLLTDPLQVTVGASGAIFGIMGALLILEYTATGSLAGPAFTLIVINLALTFAIPNISIGGHLGGLAGGIAATYALTRLRYVRPSFVAPAAVVAIGAASLLVAYVRVESYVF